MATATGAEQGSSERFGRGALPLIAVCLGFFMVIMDATIVSVALPVLQRDLSADISGLQWVTDGYTVVFASLLLSAGSFGDKFGARRVFLVGLIVFTVASAGCGLAGGLGVLNAARAVQGIGAALVLPTSLSLLQNSYPDRRQRARAIGLWGGAGGAAAALGPIVGGLLSASFGWQWVFFVNVPVGVLALLLTFRFVAPVLPNPGRGLDLVGQGAAALSVAALAYGIIAAGRFGWAATVSLVAIGVASLAAAVFVVVERRHPAPMLPPILFRRRDFGGSAVAGFALNFGFYGALFLLPLSFHHRGLSVSETGLAVFPMAAMAVIASPLAGRHAGRFGARRVALLGLLIGAAGLLGLALLDPATPYWVSVLPLVATGFGTAYTMPALTAMIIDAAPADRAGLASGTLNAARQTGGAIGVAVFGSAVAGAAGFAAGFRIGMLAGAAAFLGAAALTWCCTTGRASTTR